MRIASQANRVCLCSCVFAARCGWVGASLLIPRYCPCCPSTHPPIHPPHKEQVYEHLVHPGVQHFSLRCLPGMADRCLRIGSAGKTFSFTGWKARGGRARGMCRVCTAGLLARKSRGSWLCATGRAPGRAGPEAGICLALPVLADVAP